MDADGIHFPIQLPSQQYWLLRDHLWDLWVQLNEVYQLLDPQGIDHPWIEPIVASLHAHLMSLLDIHNNIHLLHQSAPNDPLLMDWSDDQHVSLDEV
jgi:hypothetical protein